jgi:hypothetical protein
MKPLTASHNTRKIEGVTTAAARSDSPWGLSDRAVGGAGSWQSAGRLFSFWEPMSGRRRLLFSLSLIVVSGLGALLVCWGACPLPTADPKSAEFVLQADVSSSKLNDTSAGAPGSSGPARISETSKRHTVRKIKAKKQETPAAPVEPLLLEAPEPKKKANTAAAEPVTPPQDLALPEKPAPPEKDEESAVPLDPPQPLPVVDKAPVASVAAAELAPMCSYAHYVLHQGDIPMTRTWKTFGLQTVLAAALVAAPATANAAEESKKITGNKELNKRIADLQKDLNKLKTQVKSIDETLLKVESLEGRIKGIEDGLDKRDKELKEVLEKVGKDMQGFRKDMDKVLEQLTKKNGSSKPTEGDDLTSRVAKIEKVLEQIAKRVSPPPSLYGPDETGRVLMINRYMDPITIILNGRVYRLNPGTSRLVDGVPAGTLTYDVGTPIYPSLGQRTSNLLPNETRRIVVGD